MAVLIVIFLLGDIQHGRASTLPVISEPHSVYMPIIVKNPTCLSFINGDFEKGSDGWTEFSVNNWELIVRIEDVFEPGTVYAHSGEFAAWLGGGTGEINHIEKDGVFIDPRCAYLSYYQWIGSNENEHNRDWAGVRVNGSVVDDYELIDNPDTNKWHEHTVDLGDYAGQYVKLQIWTENDSQLFSNLFVDDVSLKDRP